MLLPRPACASAASAAILALFGLAACQGPGGTAGLGRLPDELVALYDDNDPQGVMEIEADRDGSILAMEADVPVDRIPESLRQAALALTGGGRVTGGEREVGPDGSGWEVKIEKDGVGWEVIYDAAGNVVETEQSLAEADVPAAVLAGADRAIPDGARVSVELISRSGHREYHVKKRVGQAGYKMVLAPDGTLLRAVREARAELEIPLR